MNAPFWISVGTSLTATVILAGVCFDIEKLIKRNAALEADNAAIRGELAMAKRSMQAFARKLTDDTGPIAVDRPTPAPRTVTGIPSARPEVPRTGSTASEAPSTPASIGPRHRATKKKAS